MRLRFLRPQRRRLRRQRRRWRQQRRVHRQRQQRRRRQQRGHRRQQHLRHQRRPQRRRRRGLGSGGMVSVGRGTPMVGGRDCRRPLADPNRHLLFWPVGLSDHRIATEKRLRLRMLCELKLLIVWPAGLLVGKAVGRAGGQCWRVFDGYMPTASFLYVCLS